VLQVDPERERISLGVKQIDEDPFNKYLTDIKKGAIVNGTVIEADAKGVTVNLAEEVDGYIRIGDLARERLEDASEVVKVGDIIEAKYTGVDRKNRVITLSVKAKDQADEKDALEKVNNQPEDAGFASAMAEAFKAAKGE
jgi:small subunit ribosomal protein S1